MGLKQNSTNRTARKSLRTSMARRSTQLTFPRLYHTSQPLNPEPGHALSGRSSRSDLPIDNDSRRAGNVSLLMESVHLNFDFWTSLAARDQKIACAPKPEFVTLAGFLDSVMNRLNDRRASLDGEVAVVLESGLRFLSSELAAHEMNGSAFRSVWFLLWPVLSDFDLLPDEVKELRATIQRIITSSF